MKQNKNNGKSKTKAGEFTKAKRRLASDPETSPETLEQLAKAGSPDILERVAENPQATSELLESLASNAAPEVRSAVSENLNTSSETVSFLSGDENPGVRLRLAENPQVSQQVLGMLAEDENPYVASRAQETLANVKSIAEQADEMLLLENYAEAEQLYKKLVAGLDELLGSHHKEVALALHKLAAAISGEGRELEALDVEERAKLISSAHKKV